MRAKNVFFTIAIISAFFNILSASNCNINVADDEENYRICESEKSHIESESSSQDESVDNSIYAKFADKMEAGEADLLSWRQKFKEENISINGFRYGGVDHGRDGGKQVIFSFFPGKKDQ